MIGMVKLQGTVETPWLESKVLQGNLPGDATERMLPIYLPPGYAESKERYPVIFVLSGHGGSNGSTIHQFVGARAVRGLPHR